MDKNRKIMGAVAKVDQEDHRGPVMENRPAGTLGGLPPGDPGGTGVYCSA